MKRSRTVRLVAMGVSALALSACGEDVVTSVYENPAQCRGGHRVDPLTNRPFAELADACIADYIHASKQHRTVAPRYGNADDCEDEFGPEQCEPAQEVDDGAVSNSSYSGSGSSGGGGGWYYFSNGHYYNRDGTPYRGHFRPKMAGYLLSGSGKSVKVEAQPVYRSLDKLSKTWGPFRTAENGVIGQSIGQTKINTGSIAPKPSIKSSTIARGGFGKTGGIKISFGS